jgi:hypothetical protein
MRVWVGFATTFPGKLVSVSTNTAEAWVDLNPLKLQRVSFMVARRRSEHAAEKKNVIARGQLSRSRVECVVTKSCKDRDFQDHRGVQAWN